MIKCSLFITTSEEKEYHVALFLSYRPRYKVQYFTIFRDKLHSFNTQDHRSTRGLLISETIQNVRNHPYGQPVLTFDKGQICEEILKELRFNLIKNLFSLFFINGFITMCNLKKRLLRSAFWVLLQAMFMNAWKQTARRWKLHFWENQQSIKKYNSVEHLQRQQFSFTETNEYLIVSKNPQVFTTKLKD